MRQMLYILCFCSTLALARADEVFPPAGWQERPDPIASPHAVKGGLLRFSAAQPPKSLNYFVDSTTYTRPIFTLLYESLLWVDPVTTGFNPGLARRWTVSDDRRTFTFELDPAATWSDGRPVSAEDVRWTFDQVMAPATLSGPHKVALGAFEPPEVLGPRTVRFRSRENHWRNLLSAGTFEILPRHAFEGQDFNRLDFDRPVVSGPYTLESVKEQIEVRLRRRPEWWARGRPLTQHTMNFDAIVFRYYAEDENAFEAFKKDQTDVFAVYMSRLWANETSGEKFDKNWIVKRLVHNHEPIGFQGFAMNMRRPPFDDLRVRQAMACLVDRETMNRTLMFGAYFLQRSYYEDLYDASRPCPNPLYLFDPARAKALLREAGYAPNPATGLLEKGGRPLRFRFLTRDGSTDRYLALCNSAFREAGVEMQIDRKDWAAWARDMDAFNYDMTWASWSQVVFRDPEDMWHSREADRPSSNNVTGFKDPAVDALIERQKTVYDVAERNAILREIDARVAAAVPYVLLWNMNAVRLLHWDRFGMPDTVLGKTGDERSLIPYWWYDPDSAAELKSARASGDLLPARPVSVDFDAAFRPDLPSP